MNLNNLDLFLSILKSIAKKQNEAYKQHFRDINQQYQEDELLSDKTKENLLTPIIDSPQYLDVMEFIEKFPNLSLSNQFKTELMKLLNKYRLYRFNNHWMEHFYLIRDVVIMNLEFKYQRDRFWLPFGDKKDKYNARVKTIIKKYNKDKKDLTLPKLSPYERIKFFQNKCKNELLAFYSFDTDSTTTRNKNKDRNSLILELCKLTVCDNYHKNIKENLRLSGQKNYKNEMKIISDYYR